MLCPRCDRNDMLRMSRKGFLENRVLSLFGFYPWECAHCRKRSYFRKRGPGESETRPASFNAKHGLWH